ncbi:DUF1795 domain-containing protein [Burkholderia alba]|uniref:DUF1795 domain-containing protein n=1 Tax=Burkholderia alba TaxID=2683677 RepID=UPI002B05FE97|nr:DUF1795 domain-containing protein [Burkholderia alba]
MTAYRLHEGRVTLPAGWRDKTMNVFHLPDDAGRKDVAFVVTRDYDTPLDDVAAYADAQQAAFKKQFPAYKPLLREAITLDGLPALMLEYQWRSDKSVLRQRQAMVRLDDAMLVFTLNARTEDFDRHIPAWESILASFKHLPPEPEPVEAPSLVATGVLPHVFALSGKTRVLHVYPNADAAVAAVDAQEVEDHHWVFFASDGSPLAAKITQRSRHGLFKATGRYELHPNPADPGLRLAHRLNAVAGVEGSPPFASIHDIASYMNRLAGARAP